MTEPDRQPDQPPAISKEPPTLEYGRQPTGLRTEITPAQHRRILLWSAGITLAITFVWCLAMFWTRTPAIDAFCICGFMSLILALAWIAIGWQLLVLTW